MSKFNVGDSLICVEPGDNFITKGQTYTVLEINSTMVNIRNDKGVMGHYYNYRFLLVEKTLQDVVDTIEFFAQSLLSPPKASLGQVWMWKNDEAQQRVIIGVFNNRAWLADFCPKQSEISCFSLSLEQVYNGYKYSHTVSEFAGHKF